MTAPELAAWIADPARPQPVLLDVREPREHQICMIEGSVPIPMNTIPLRMSELETDAPIVCICHHGGRSMQVANFLEQNGFTNMINLAGGIHAWSQQVDPSMPTY
jgi:rhodanese-related sulfurtransferase